MLTQSFLGTGWGFPPTFRRGKNGVDMVSDERDIKESLHILLTTRLGERIMHPQFGCNLEDLLFESLDTRLRAYMEDVIRTAILYHEPRILLNEVNLTPDTNEGRILISVDFTIPGTNSRYNFVYPFYETEGIQLIP